MQPNLSNRFLTFDLTEEEERAAKTVNPYFLAYLQNKIAAYANAIVEENYQDEKNKIDSKEVALLRHERLQAQVLVLEELFKELQAQVLSEPPPNNAGIPEDPNPTAFHQ